MSKKKSAKDEAVEAALEAAANQEPSPLEFVETDFTEVSEEDPETVVDEEVVVEETTAVESILTTASESMKDVRPEDNVFVRLGKGLFASAKVVAVPGEANCFGLRVKALRNKVFSVHSSRVSTTAEQDNVVRRLRLSPNVLRSWVNPL